VLNPSTLVYFTNGTPYERSSSVTMSDRRTASPHYRFVRPMAIIFDCAGAMPQLNELDKGMGVGRIFSSGGHYGIFSKFFQGCQKW